MDIRSLGLQTDMIFHRFDGVIVDRGTHIVVRTPENPHFHFGNYLIFDRAPRAGDLAHWTALFAREFAAFPQVRHYTFAWDGAPATRGETTEFENEGYDLDETTVLVASAVTPPPKTHPRAEIHPLSSDEDWEAATRNQIAAADPKHLVNGTYEPFKRAQMASYRQMTAAGHGAWFGAFVDGKLWADLGIFHHRGIGRYQQVVTHPEARRQGLCGTLVYTSARYAFEVFGVKQLVMAADPHYHAARIYESVGFRPRETSYAMCWWPGKT